MAQRWFTPLIFDEAPTGLALDSSGGASLRGDTVVNLSADGRHVVCLHPAGRCRRAAAVYSPIVVTDPSGNFVVATEIISPTFPAVNPLQMVGKLSAFPFLAGCGVGLGNNYAYYRLPREARSARVRFILVRYGWPGRGRRRYLRTKCGLVGQCLRGDRQVRLDQDRTGSVHPPLFVAAGVVSSADFKAGIAPGGLVLIFLHRIDHSPGARGRSFVPPPNTLEGTSVRMNGRTAPVLAVADVNGQE